MIRLASHRIYFSHSSYISNGVLVLDVERRFIELFPLQDCFVEPANTIFYDEDILLMRKGESPENGDLPFSPNPGDVIDVFLRKNSSDDSFVSLW
ncbi:MAG: hypothetical protein IKY58_05280 [Paludibacteraceae bacterium]|nr:hypothetical protein [Paludibacteraceae bacterium]